MRRTQPLAALLFLSMAAPTLASGPSVPTFQLKWGSAGVGPGQFTNNWGVASDVSGNVYVVDQGNSRVEEFDHRGSLLNAWGYSGSGAGEFNAPSAVAIGAGGVVYVVDTSNHRIQRFDGAGTYLGQWGSLGAAAGQFNTPTGIATDAAGNVYVVDRVNQRIQKFTPTGGFLAQWGTSGAGNGQFNNPVAVAADGAGNVYVADFGNSRVQKFTASGTFVLAWGVSGTGNGQFTYPYDVAVDGVGNVLVLDAGNCRVQKFTSAGSYLAQFGGIGFANGQLFVPRGLDVDAAGDVYVTDTGNARVQKFSSAGLGLSDVAPTFLSSIGSAGAGAGQFSTPAGVSVASDGSYFVSDYGNNRIQKFSSSGTFIVAMGSPGSGPMQLNGPTGLACEGDGQLVHVVDSNNHRVQDFLEWTPGVWVQFGEFGSFGSGPGQFNSPHGVVYVPGNRLLVTDFYNHRVQIFSLAGFSWYYSGEWGSYGSGPGQFSGPAGIAIDRFSNVYVTDFGGSRVQKFTSYGQFLLQWGSAGNAPGQFNSPIGVTVDANDNVYVSDYGNDRVQKFTGNGVFLAEMGYQGGPRDPAVDAAGNLYVPQGGNQRVAKYAVPATVAMVSDIRGDQGLQTRLRVLRSSLDAPGSPTPITRYDVFRRIDPLATSAAEQARAGDASPASAQLAGWDQVGTFSAYGESEYNVVVPTLVNSTPASLEYTAYMVRAATASPYTFYDSAPEYGYSADNLTPGMPTPFTAALAAGSTNLHWGVSAAADFSTFRLYRGASAGFVPVPGNLVATTPDTGFVDAGAAGFYYKLAAVDFNGNESPYALVGPAQTLDAPTEGATLEFGLDDIRPNPVRGRELVVRFALPDAGKARLELIDVTGRRVADREVSGAGRHTVGLARDAGMPPGVYLVRLSRGASVRVRRAVVID